MITLDLHKDLPKVRAAFDARQMALHTRAGNTYGAPCAIGAMLSVEDRKLLDSNSGYSLIASFIIEGEVSAPEDQHQDLRRLQGLHDNGEHVPFNAFLIELEAKYVPA